MRSKPPKSSASCFVWIWLPGKVDPVVAGILQRGHGRSYVFRYGKSYLERKDAIAINRRELPLSTEVIVPDGYMLMPSAIRDGAPDAWGRRVILNMIFGDLDAEDRGHQELDEMTYLLQSGSDRIGALDFQLSSNDYIARQSTNARLEELLEASERVENGIPLTPALEVAINHGSSIGGARPKAQIVTDDIKYIAKFSSTKDEVNYVGGEFLAMRIASLAGMNVAPVRLERALGKDVLLVERFDRVKAEGGWNRRLMSSALTLLGLDEMQARYCSYEEFTDIIRREFSHPQKDLRELFSRLVFNILCGNTDDHGRNHAAFFDGDRYQLTPAYDICPQVRNGGEATQAMRILGEKSFSSLALCIEACEKFLITDNQAAEIIQHQLNVIGAEWSKVADEAKLSIVDRNVMRSTQWLNPYAFYGLQEGPFEWLIDLSDDVRRML